MYWGFLGILFLISAVGCCCGFKNFVWFLSIGYGISVALMGVSYLFIGINQAQPMGFATVTACFLFIVYGARLAGFLLMRELKNASYKKVLDQASKDTAGDKPMPIFVKVAIWIFAAALYVVQTSPVFFRIMNGNGAELMTTILGVFISVIGVSIEAVADKQKSEQKAKRPDMVATEGLFKSVRCPNYFGEITFWTGVFIGGLTTYRGIGQWLFAIIGYVAIVYIMINGAQRLDRRQEKANGHKPEYRAYADSTPLIVPFIPVSHIGSYKD